MRGAGRVAIGNRRWQVVPMSDVREWIDRELHALIVDRDRLVAEILAAYDRLEEEALRRVDGHSEIGLKREFASLRLVAAKQRGANVETARELFDRCEELGYESPEARLNAAAVFARVCLSCSRLDLERGELDAALREVPVGRYPGIEQLAKELAKLRSADG